MTKEEKELLLSDICARLPYRPKFDFHVEASNEHFLFTLKGIELYDGDIAVAITDRGKFTIPKGHVKPYLFPLSSMTVEQKKELDDTLIELELRAVNDEIPHHKVAESEIDFYNRYHFDYRGLIPMGLAIDTTGLNIY